MALYENINWKGGASLYVLKIDGNIKFGVTSNFQRRIRAYKKECEEGVSIRTVRVFEFSKYWEAEFIEQMMKWQLRPFAFDGRHEWIDVPEEVVLNCFDYTMEKLGTDLKEFEGIHRKKK